MCEAKDTMKFATMFIKLSEIAQKENYKEHTGQLKKMVNLCQDFYYFSMKILMILEDIGLIISYTKEKI